MFPNRPCSRFFLLLLSAVLVAQGTPRPVAAQPPSPPQAATRVAVLVGANVAVPGRVPLLFGHDDARKMANVLISVAGFRAQDVVVLNDPNAGDLMVALQTAADRLADRPESLLYFYYSGHADERAIYPAGQPLPLARLRVVMDSARVSVRIGMVDACHGGGWTRAKSLRPDEPFAVRWPLSLDNEGSVLIASSSGLESAHESDQLRGSFFTHHFAVGLRGAADRNGNGEVTITEAFEYAKEHTIRDTLRVAREPQHPSYAVNLRGRRDLVLAQLSQSSSTLRLTQQQGPLELIHIESGVALLELPEGPRNVRLAVPPGIYLVRKKFPESILTKEVAIQAGTSTTIDEAQLTLVGNQQLVAKSPPIELPPDQPALRGGAPNWAKLGAISLLSVSALSFAVGYKIALDVKGVYRDLEPFRRFPCQGQDGLGDVVCAEDGVTVLGQVSQDELRYTSELHREADRFERFQYIAFMTGTGLALLSIPFIVKWNRAHSTRTIETTSLPAWELAPTWGRGPGFSLSARF